MEKKKFRYMEENCEKLHLRSPKIDNLTKVHRLLTSSCPILSPFKYLVDIDFKILNLKYY